MKSYHDKMMSGSEKTYVQKVVAQPTKQSNVKAKVDPKSPSGISEVKGDGRRSD
jgi:hypothetical protein